MKIQKLTGLVTAGLIVSTICQMAFADDGDPGTGGGVQPAAVCHDFSGTGCTVATSTFKSKSCYDTDPTGCCQVKIYDYTCVGSSTVLSITHSVWNSNVFGGTWHCDIKDCKP